MTIDFRVTSPRPVFVAGEDVLLSLELENRGATPVWLPSPEANANWQPAYTLTGPGPQDVASFSFRSLARRRGPKPTGPGDATLMELAPGATWSGTLPLSQLLRRIRPGAYTFNARLTWDAVDVAAPPVQIVVEPLRDVALSIGLGLPGTSFPEIYAAWLHEGAGGKVLFQSIHGEERPDLGEMHRRGIARLAEPSADASEVFVPWAQHSRFEDMVGWVLWREGSVLHGLPTMALGRAQVALPFEPAFWLLPALESRTHEVDLFAVGGPERRTLAMIRFEHGGFATPPQARVVWSVELPAPVLSGAVSPQPNAPARLRHVALVTGEANQVTVRHAVLDGLKPPSTFAEVTLEDWVAAPSTPPAVVAHEKGGARVMTLLASVSDPARCRLVELLFGPPHPAHPSAQSSSVILPVPPAEGRIGYFRDPGTGAIRSDWAVRGTDGVTYARGGGSVRVARLATENPPPLALLVLQTTTYLLERSADGAFVFEMS